MVLHESTENYLKTLLILQRRLGQVRAVDVARELGVSKPSVSIAMKKLRGEGLVEVDGNRNLLLTKTGETCASAVLERHAVIERYLIDVLDVDEETAHHDSCRMEHMVSDETFDKMKKRTSGLKLA